jgi:hypothetical protein
LESAGTITVVVFVGGGGLLLLMQPDSTGITAINKLARTFIAASLSKAAKPGSMLNPKLNAAVAPKVPANCSGFLPNLEDVGACRYQSEISCSAR